jgi:hypothetical protein
MIDDDDEDDCGELGRMRNGSETEVLGEILLQFHLVHHLHHEPTWTRTRAAVVESRLLTT